MLRYLARQWFDIGLEAGTNIPGSGWFAPVELVERAVRNSSKTRDLVLDPFGGSGSTLIACEKSGRRARLIELDPKYVDVIVKRWEEFTGKKAVRVGDQVPEQEPALEPV